MKTEEMIPHDPKYRAINKIPHAFDPGRKHAGDMVDRWLHETFRAEDKEMLLQYCGYCLTKDTSQQKFLILCGAGGTGKSTVIRLLEEMIGADNVSNISLKQLEQRFASFGLMGKLLNSCADLEVTTLEDTSLIKKILGEDSIRAEPKGTDDFSFKSYARMVFSTNELPIVLNEKTNGFFMRRMILKMDKLPSQKDPYFFEHLNSQIDHFIALCVEALGRMHAAGAGLCESRSSKEAVADLRRESDTVEAWLAERCVKEEASKDELD